MPGSNVGLRRRRVAWGVALGLGLLLRVWFLRHPMPPDDDTDVYAELAANLFHHGIYGIAADGVIVPTLIRLPGYPVFLGIIFALFGAGNFHAVLVAQVALDLLGCWLIAQFVREQMSERAGTVAIFLAALCPFTAAYSTIALTECLSVFAVSLGLWGAGRMFAGILEAPGSLLGAARFGEDGRVLSGVGVSAVIMTACGMALAMLLRPDGVLLSAAVLVATAWYGWRQRRVGLAMRRFWLCGLLALLPLMPWAVRNWRTFHVVQPLAPRRVNEAGEYVTYGFYRWMNTWAIDIVSTGNVFWRMGTGEIAVNDLPARAMDSPVQRAETARLLADYNVGRAVTPELDERFRELAQERLRAHPVLCLVWVPVLRVGDMWLRPRTETMGLDADWWRFNRHRDESMEAVALGLVNLLLVGAAVVGVWRRRVTWVALPVAYVVLRCLLLSTMENSEPRYTLEAFPLVLACAACGLSRAGGGGREEGECLEL